MIAVLRAALVATLVAASIPAVAEGQEPSSDSLIHRIDLLERRTADLEQRVHELEALIKTEPARDRPAPVSAASLQFDNDKLAGWSEPRR